MQLSAPVGVQPDGQQCDNVADDQVQVIDLLDAVDPSEGGTRPADGDPVAWTPPVDGTCADDLYQAVRTFQGTQGVDTVSGGVVEPGSATLARLEELAGASTAQPDPAPGPGPQLRLWVNAFIPGSLPGLTVEVPGSPGSTMLPGPVPGVSDCFLTDQRDFSSDLHASSRMHCEVVLDLAQGTVVSTDDHCDESVEVDCEDGDVEGRARGDASRIRWSAVSGSAGTQSVVDLEAAASNPLFTGSPDIDVTGSFTVDVAARTVHFVGKVDEFPAFEAYAQHGEDDPVTLLRLLPVPGKTPADLFGGADRPVDVSAAF